MKIVILAAGVGSRLQPITATKPKCLVRVAGRPILEWQIRAFAALNPEQIIIVAGYRYEMVRAFCASLGNPAVVVRNNAEYATTNNMFSLSLVSGDVAGKEFILCNGDVVFDPAIAAGLASAGPNSAIAADQGSYAEESMKVVVDGDGNVRDISKGVSSERAWGCSIDLYRFNAADSLALFREIDRTVVDGGDRVQWTEVAIQHLVQDARTSVRPWDIGGRAWVEVDNYADLSIADVRFADTRARAGRWKVMFLDLDGTVYVGGHAVPGADAFVRRVVQGGISLYFLSNNSSRSKGEYLAKLGALGIPAEPQQMVLSTDGLVEFLVGEKAKEVFAIGTAALRHALEKAGINPVSDDPAWVVLGYDTELTYERLARGATFLNAGVRYVATHPDLVCPTPDGPVPDAGAFAKLLEITTGRTPERVFGKPNVEMIEHIVRSVGARWNEVVIVGDRIYTDGELARRSGADFVLVLSGETRREDVERVDVWPTLVVPSVASLADVMKA